VNLAARAKHLEKLVAEYRPSTTMVYATCEMLAGILERVETVKPGSPEHQRLVQSQSQLFATLEASQSSEPRTSAPDLATLSDDDLIARTTALLHHLLDARDFRTRQDARPATVVPTQPSGASDADASLEPTPPAPEPVCEFCMRPCVGEAHLAYRVLHWLDPNEVAKRDARATATMMTRGRHGHQY
jgi:hypothetical protein